MYSLSFLSSNRLFIFFYGDPMLVSYSAYERVAFIAINTAAESLGYMISSQIILPPESSASSVLCLPYGNYHRWQNLPCSATYFVSSVVQCCLWWESNYVYNGFWRRVYRLWLDTVQPMMPIHDQSSALPIFADKDTTNKVVSINVRCVYGRNSRDNCDSDNILPVFWAGRQFDCLLLFPACLNILLRRFWRQYFIGNLFHGEDATASC